MYKLSSTLENITALLLVLFDCYSIEIQSQPHRGERIIVGEGILQPINQLSKKGETRQTSRLSGFRFCFIKKLSSEKTKYIVYVY